MGFPREYRDGLMGLAGGDSFDRLKPVAVVVGSVKW